MPMSVVRREEDAQAPLAKLRLTRRQLAGRRAILQPSIPEDERMSVRAGREFLAIPGPTTVPDEVLGAMHRPAVDIYSGPLVGMTDSLLADMTRIFRTEGRA